MYKDFHEPIERGEQPVEPAIDRRDFVKGGAAAVAFSALGTRVASAAPSLPFTGDYRPISRKPCPRHRPGTDRPARRF